MKGAWNRWGDVLHRGRAESYLQWEVCSGKLRRGCADKVGKCLDDLEGEEHLHNTGVRESPKRDCGKKTENDTESLTAM